MISVIIPTLNEEKYIEHTLKALQCQDYKGKYEIIVSDGGSKDSTVKIAKKYADKVIVLREKGISKGRNAGAKIAKGNIFLFVDADTVLLFNALSEIEKEFRKKNVVGVACPILPLSAHAKDFILYWSFNQFSKTTTKTKKAKIAGICFACRKSAFKKIGGYDESIEIGEDFDLSERLSKLGKFKFNEKTLALTSPRRIQQWGRAQSVKKYMKIYLNWFLKGKRVYTRETYEPIR